MKKFDFFKKTKPKTGYTVNPAFEELLEEVLTKIYDNRVHLSYKDLDKLKEYTELKEYHEKK